MPHGILSMLEPYEVKVSDYHGYQEDFEGEFTAPGTYQSTYELIQWGLRGDDTFYCIDIFDANWNMLHQAIKCDEGLHSYSPQELNLQPGTYRWKVWSHSGYGGEGFEGTVSCLPEWWDEIEYLNRNIDITDAVGSGVLPNGYQHYITDGYTEGRQGYPDAWDEQYYLQLYPDVADAITSGSFINGYQHYILHGRAEGREIFKKS